MARPDPASMTDAHLLDDYLTVYRDGGKRRGAIRAELEKRLAEVERLRAENQTMRSNLETLGLIDPDDIAEGERQAKGGKWVTLVDTREEFWEEGDAAKEAGHD